MPTTTELALALDEFPFTTTERARALEAFPALSDEDRETARRFLSGPEPGFPPPETASIVGVLAADLSRLLADAD